MLYKELRLLMVTLASKTLDVEISLLLMFESDLECSLVAKVSHTSALNYIPTSWSHATVLILVIFLNLATYVRIWRHSL